MKSPTGKRVSALPRKPQNTLKTFSCAFPTKFPCDEIKMCTTWQLCSLTEKGTLPRDLFLHFYSCAQRSLCVTRTLQLDTWL